MTDDQTAKKTILVIDDEEDVVVYLQTLLEDSGYAVITASDGAEGLAAAKEHRPDLISLDITMPERSGVGFYKDVRRDPELSSVPVVIVTGVTGIYGGPEEFERFISTRRTVRPPDGFIAKPIDRDELLKTFGELLGG